MVWVSALHTEGREFETLSPALAHSLFFLSGYLLCGSQFMWSKFNCNILGWKTVPFIFT